MRLVDRSLNDRRENPQSPLVRKERNCSLLTPVLIHLCQTPASFVLAYRWFESILRIPFITRIAESPDNILCRRTNKQQHVLPTATSHAHTKEELAIPIAVAGLSPPSKPINGSPLLSFVVVDVFFIFFSYYFSICFFFRYNIDLLFKKRSRRHLIFSTKLRACMYFCTTHCDCVLDSCDSMKGKG